ncbi:MAG: S9 family peptidase [Pirellulales bacterium]|nr:S9 family peptidase [Pirellulales bacterium]
MSPRLQIARLCIALLLGLGSSLVCAEEDPRRPAAIETTGVSPIPDELAARLSQYDDIRSAQFEDWSPDGRGMLVRTQFGNSPQLHRVDEPGGRRDQVTFYREPVTGRFIPQSNDGSILLSYSEGGSENDQIVALDPKQFTHTSLTDGKSRNLVGPITRDGKHFAFASNRRNGRDMDLYISSTARATGQEMILKVENETWIPSNWSPDGSRLLIARYVSQNESYPVVFDVATRKKTPIEWPKNSSTGPIAFEQLTFSSDGAAVYLATDAHSEFTELAKIDLASGDYIWLSADIPWDVTDIDVDHDRGNVAFVVNADGVSSVYLIRGGQREKLPTPEGVIGSLKFSPDGQQLGFTLAKSNAPPDAYSLDIATGRATRWTYSEVGGLDPAKFVAAEAIEFPSFDGRMIPAWIYRPPADTRQRPAAVLLHIHGGPESQYLPVFSPNIQFYAIELGIAVVCPNVRGSQGYGKTFLRLDNAEKREDSVKDIGALLDWIAKQPDLDASRVAVEGGSYGGYMVLASLTHFGQRIKAGIDIVGIANFLTFLERTAPYRRDLRRAEYGDERNPPMKAVFERISPLANADKIHAALMVAHGRNDPRVPLFEAEQIVEKVKSQGGTVWTVYAANEGHGFQKRDNRDYLRAASVMFLRQQLEVE